MMVYLEIGQLSLNFGGYQQSLQYLENKVIIIGPSGSGTGKKKKMTGVNIQQE